MSIESQVKQMIAEHLSKPVDAMMPGAHLVDDLGADSLDLSELVITFEQTFRIRIPSEAAKKMVTVGDTIAYLVAHVPAGTAKAAAQARPASAT